MENLLLVLIDGLPEHKVTEESAPYLHALRHGPLTPGMGFSVNIHPEMLGGLRPDDLGYFNLWHPAADPTPPSWPSRIARWLLDLSRFDPRVSRLLHVLIHRLTPMEATGNVPFRLLPYFEKQEKADLFGGTIPSIFQYGEWTSSIGSDVRAAYGDRDPRVVEATLDQIASEGGSQFVLLSDLDALAHSTGVGSSYDAHLSKVDRWAQELTTAFRAVHGPRAPAVFFSDHGMDEVVEGGVHKMDLEAEFGPSRPGRYLFVLDAVMARVWVYDESLRDGIRDYFASLQFGFLMTEQQRNRYGVSNPAFGDLIFMLDEGHVIHPSFFAGRVPRAVHGYFPEFPSQQAYLGLDGSGPDLPTRSHDLYPFLKAVMGVEGTAE